jgi:hypothetical protein
MPASGMLVFAATLLFCGSGDAWGQDLALRAYVIAPEHSNAITLTHAYYTGNGAEQVGVTQMNGSNRDGRCSCAAVDVCSNPLIRPRKTLLHGPASLEIAR